MLSVSGKNSLTIEKPQSEGSGIISTLGLLITVGAIIATYAKYGDELNLKKGGVYSRIQQRRKLMDDCVQCTDH